jgi:hypothetical protein
MKYLVFNLVLMCLFLSCTKKESTASATKCYRCELHNVITAEVTFKDTCVDKNHSGFFDFRDKDGNHMNYICTPK